MGRELSEDTGANQEEADGPMKVCRSTIGCMRPVPLHWVVAGESKSKLKKTQCDHF